LVSVAAGDFDHDGRSDVIAGDFNSFTVSILLSRAPRFVGWSENGSGYPSTDLRLVDMNDDGKLDVLNLSRVCFSGCGSCHGCQNQLEVILGDGAGGFGSRWFANGPVSETAQASMAAADFDVDGVPDVVVALADDPHFDFYRGNGDGTLASSLATHFGEGRWDYPQAGDFDEDGFPDLVAYAKLLRGVGDGTFTDAGVVERGGPYVAKDLNGDGHLDLVGPQYTGTPGIWVQLGHGDLTFDPAVTYSSPVAGLILVRDIDADGYLDVLQNESGNAGFFKGHGDGTFDSAVQTTIGANQMAAPDLDGDGRPDLVCTTGPYSPNLDVAGGVGDGTFSTDATASTADVYPVQIAAGDVNGDGLEDVAVGTAGNFSGQGGDASIAVLLGVPGVGTTAVAPVPARSRTQLELSIRPNPSRTTTHIDFVMPRAGNAAIELLDLAGRRVATVFRGELTAGVHSARWDGRKDGGVASPGMYFARLSTGGEQVTRRIVWMP
jgi:hypothetical protein